MTMRHVTYDRLSNELIKVAPELRAQYEEELRWWGDETPGPHIIYGDVLNPYLISLLEADDESNEEVLRRIYGFLEALANHDDERVQEVVAVTVCERLGASKELLERAHRYMGPKTRQLSDEIEAFWRGERR